MSSGVPRADEHAARLPLTALAGVGPVRAARLARLGLVLLEDLLRLAPRRLERHAGLLSVAAAREREGEEVSVVGQLGPFRFYRRGGRRSVLSVTLREEESAIEATWFGQPWLRDKLLELQRAGAPVALSGRVVRTRKGPALVAPKLRPASELAHDAPRLVPVYPATEGVSQELLRGWIASARERATLPEPLAARWLEAHGLPSLPSALEGLHAPRSLEEHARARRRLALERLLALEAQLGALRLRSRAARALALDARARERLLARLPFRPTAAQARVLAEILDDLARERPMRRLLQGDVGSGKTLVALAACLAVAEAGGQAALLAPTELLAEQHALGLAAWDGWEELGAVLVTGSLARAERARAASALEEGRARLAIGTHALFSADVRFRRLDLVVVDEQQRFGVAQRRALVAKGEDVHALAMSATPIPRTLALALWADLELSRLDERPPGRGPLETRLVAPDGRARVLEELARRVARGERAFWVCPRVGAGEEEEGAAAAAERVHAELARGPLGAHGVELVHGRVEAQERGRRLARFRDGRARTLVATSVIEVGVDVPAASLMVIESAERFGVAQLHQLRGRVGRGPTPSTCFLLADPEAEVRLGFLATEHDGFAIAEVDLEQRGMGELSGARQSGHEQDELADPLRDADLVALARELLERDPTLAERYREAGARALDRLV